MVESGLSQENNGESRRCLHRKAKKVCAKRRVNYLKSDRGTRTKSTYRNKRCTAILSTKTTPSEPLHPTNSRVPGVVMFPPTTKIPEPPIHWRQPNNTCENPCENLCHKYGPVTLLDNSYSQDTSDSRNSSNIGCYHQSGENRISTDSYTLSTSEHKDSKTTILKCRDKPPSSFSLVSLLTPTDIAVSLKNKLASPTLLSSKDSAEISFNSKGCSGVCCEIAFNLRPPSYFISS